MTKALQELAGGKLVVALEGGYDLPALQSGMVACVSALLREAAPAPAPELSEPLNGAQQQVDGEVLELFVQIQEQLAPHWPGIAWPSISAAEVAAAPRKLAAEAAAAIAKLQEVYGAASEAAWEASKVVAQPASAPQPMCSVCNEFTAGADGMCSVCSRNAA